MGNGSTVEVIVEVPSGSRNKYEIDPASGEIWLDRTLFTATVFPLDYGCVPGTLGPDDDPLDALVICEEPTFPGCHIRCRPIAVLGIRSKKGDEGKILCVPVRNERCRWKDLDDVPRHLVDEISHFFDVYKDLGPGKSKKVGDWAGRSAAEDEIRRARHRFTRRQRRRAA
jgi:inorganic pyrophosphatase